MRIFFDTNVIIGAYLWKGVARQVFEMAITDYEPFISEDVITDDGDSPAPCIRIGGAVTLFLKVPL